jgi:glycerol-3-phosphate dehydrogenase (NAD(P)+)
LVTFTSDLSEALDGAECVVESVTSAGLRPVLEKVKALGPLKCPLVMTSKGIEQDTGLLLHEVALDVFGSGFRDLIACLSGPSLADEVIKQLPTSVVSASHNKELMNMVSDLFASPFFRVYPNSDLSGVSFGGAMKNIMAIACGISDGLGFGDNTKAALMTRGLHEIRKLSVTKGCRPETLNGLSGMGDLCVTCLSTLSRNYSFGRLIAEGLTPKDARAKIGMAVEGMYTCVSARQLGQKHKIPVPITEAIYAILYQDLNPRDAVKALLQREIKEEHL